MLSRLGNGGKMRARDVLLTGLPRVGTTLACHLLNTLPDAVGLDEPTLELDEPLESCDRNKVYEAAQVKEFARRLLDTDAAFWDFYSREDVAQVAEG